VLDLLSKILCWIEKLPVLVLIAIVDGINELLVGIGALIDLLVGILPDMPDVPNITSDWTEGIGWANYFFPLAYAVDLLGTILALWLTWLLVSIALRWVKGVGT
jgi:hypothetical protein